MLRNDECVRAAESGIGIQLDEKPRAGGQEAGVDLSDGGSRVLSPLSVPLGACIAKD